MVKLLPRIGRKQLPPPVEEPEEEIEDGHELRMGFFEHLDELRHRLTRAFLALIVGTVVGAVIAEPVLEFILEPYRAISANPEQQLVILGPTGSIVAYFKVALMLGGIFAIPLITYQVLAFIVPGLTSKEKRYVRLSIPPITFLFLVGVTFAWYGLMPPAISFLEGFMGDVFRPEWTAQEYISFVTSLLFWMGVAFETPLAFFVLSLLGLVSASQLIRNWRFAVVGAAIAAAFITPTVDPVNMMLVMGPLLALYAFSILLVWIGRRMSGVDA